MKKNPVSLLIALMALSLVGLVALQVYWISRDLETAEQNFDRNATFAINQSIDQFLEKQITSRSHFTFSSSLSSFSVDSVASQLNLLSGSDSQRFSRGEFKIKTQSTVVRTEGLERFDDKQLKDKKVQLFVRTQSSSMSLSDSPGSSTQLKTILIERNAHPSNRLQSTQILSGSVTRPLSYLTLDTLLSKEVEKQHLPTDYELLVWNHEKNTADYQSHEGLISPENEKGFAVSLPTRGNSTQEAPLLWVHFPQRKQFIWEEVGSLLVASAILISVVALIFWLAVRTILLQKKISEVKNDFINNMTHEFKTPISNVSLALEAMENFGMMEQPETRQKYLAMARKENQRLGSQVEKVLQLALLEKADFELTLTEVDIHQLIEQTAERFRLQVIERGGELRTQLDAANSCILGDELHLSNLLSNLLDNAIKYSRENLEIVIRTRDEGEQLCISVSDRGIGIPKHEQKAVFEKFHRVTEGNLHQVKGFGLGLSYVAQVAKRHGGRVSVRTRLGKGSEFELYLPTKQAPAK